MAQALVYLLVLCWRPNVKSRRKGRVSFTDTFTYPDFRFLVPNNLDIDCVAGHFPQLLNLV